MEAFKGVNTGVGWEMRNKGVRLRGPGFLCDWRGEYKIPPTGNEFCISEAGDGWAWRKRFSVRVHEGDCFVTILTFRAYQTSILSDPGTKPKTLSSKILGQAPPLLATLMLNAQGIERPPVLCE